MRLKILFAFLFALKIAVAGEEVTNKFYSSSGKWIKASNTNCLIWSSFPKEGELVTWSGSVVDGKAEGKGIVQWFTNGIATTSYEGEMKQGLPSGHGIAKGSSSSFEGEWEKGSLVSTNIIVKYWNGIWYKGQYKGAFKHGIGEEMMRGGVRYVGEFKYDRFDGKGEMIWPNGDKIVGNWKDSKLDGIGSYVPKNGEPFKVQMGQHGIERL